MRRKWKISLFSILFLFMIFVVTACDKKTDSGKTEEGGNTETTEWSAWVVTKPATCSEEGVETRTSKTDSTKTETRTIQKLAHTPGQPQEKNVVAATCLQDGSHDDIVYCTQCNKELSKEHHIDTAFGHKYHDHSTAATCEHAETITYTCDNCGDSYSVTGAPMLKHELMGEQTEESTLVQGETCKYQVVVKDKCTSCGKDIVLSTNYIYLHDHSAQITKAATCTEAGTITYTCSHDNDTYTEVIPVNLDAHNWGQGNLDSTTGITTYKCSLCELEKTSFSAKDKVEQQISNAVIQQAHEIELKNAVIAFDENAKAALGTSETVTLKADTVDTNTLNLDTEVAERIGSNTVFDFSCQVGENQVSDFNGSVKVTIPYELSQGEDPNRIAIWYLADDGDPEQIDAVYSNGFVTFETSHFSKYVVVKLTPEELCQKMDVHNMVLVGSKEASCTEYGQIMYACTRCGHVEYELTSMLDHDFDIDHEHSLAPTYDAEGYTEYACRNCDATKRIIIPMKPRPTDNRIQNLINSLFEDDYFISVDGLEKLANVAMANSQIKLTEDGNIYMISKAVNESTGEEMISIVDLNAGLAYVIGDSGYDIGEAHMNFDLNKVKKYVYAVTENIPTDLGNMLLEKALPILFDVETVDNTVTLTFNMEKLITLYDNLLNKTIAENIDILVGEGTSAAMTKFVSDLLDMTVGELMTKLEGFGITPEKISELTKEFNNGTPLLTPEAIKTVLEMVKTMKVLDVINMLIPMAKEMMQSQNQQAVKQEETGPLSIGEDGTTTTEPENPTTAEEDDEDEFTPITKKQIMDGLTGILAMKVTDIVAMFAPNAEAMLANLPTKEQLTTLTKDVLDLKITLNNKYQFKKLEVEVKFNAAIKQMIKSIPANMDIDITAVIEHQNKEDLFDVQAKIKEVKDTISLIDISLDNYEWYIEALNEYLDTTGNNNLTYTFTKINEGYLIESSKFDVPYAYGNEGDTIKAFYKFLIRNSSYSSRYISKDSNGFYKHIDIYGNVVYVLPDGQYDTDDIRVPGYVYYNPTTRKYSLNEQEYEVSLIKYEVITYEQYAEYSHTTMPKNDNYVYYRYQYLGTNRWSYSYSSVGQVFNNTVYRLTPEEAKRASTVETRDGVTPISYDYGIGSYSIKFIVTEDGVQYSGIVANTTVNNPIFRNGLRAGAYKYSSQDVTTNVDLATFKVQFQESRVIDECATEKTVKISIDGGATFVEYKGIEYDHKGDIKKEKTVEGCNAHYVETCETCHRVVRDYNEEEHDVEAIPAVGYQASGTMPGVMVLRCKKCGKQLTTYQYYCDHANHAKHNDETDEYTCSECGFSWFGEAHPVIFLQQSDDEALSIRYQLANGYYAIDRFIINYTVDLFISYEGEDGTEFERLNLQPLYASQGFYSSEAYKMDEYSYYYFSFTPEEVREALAEYAEIENYTLMIGVFNNEGYAYYVEIDF